MTSSQIIKRSQRQRMVHAAMDAYLRWRDECDAVSDAYRRWADMREPGAEPAWRAYEAALDREEPASALYAEQIHHVAELAAAEPLPVMSCEVQRGARGPRSRACTRTPAPCPARAVPTRRSS